jgi:hypothetical protein
MRSPSYNTTAAHGNGGAAFILPPTPKVITGRSLVHRQLDARQRAVVAADILDGLVRFCPSQTQLASLCGVSVVYIDLARKLTPGKREAILRGSDPQSFAELLHSSRLLVPNCASITNKHLEMMIRAAGIERVLDIACVVEHS